VRHSVVDVGVPVGFWRSVGHSQNTFFLEAFIDECATVAKQDPLAYRLALLRAALKLNPNDKLAARCIKLLEAVAAKAHWGQALAPVEGSKVGRGIALAESFHSIVAEVAEVVVSADNQVRVRRVVAAVDCGFAVDPVNVVAQVRSGIHFGLTAALYGRIDIEAGRAKQSNYNDYRMVTLADAPAVDVIIVPSDAALGGIGEVGTPPIAPAVVNAIRAATGRMVRELPLSA
jgi:isoquinoline 1-oxidoreductase subunit beta